MEIVVFIIIVAGCILCHKLSASYNRQIEEKYCQGCINWWWSALTAVLAVITVGFAEDAAFLIFLVLTIASWVLSTWLTYKKIVSWGADKKEAQLGSAAQAASVVGVAAAIIFFLLLFFGGSNGKNRRR